jgi:uncharacterized protein (TIGR03000 family)
MRKLLVCVTVCAALVLSAASLWAGGELDSKGNPSVKTSPTKSGRESTIVVHLPTNETKLYFDNAFIKGAGMKRTYKSPALAPGKRFTYKVVAVWVENGSEVSHETSIVFQAGEDVAVDFRR